MGTGRTRRVRIRVVGAIVVAAAAIANGCVAEAAGRLLIFGDENHKTFLGCLSCSSSETDSVHNTLGLYGYSGSAYSIFNSSGVYGSSMSWVSPCNETAPSPPALVDDDGKFYGYLTINASLSSAVRNPKTQEWLRFKVCHLK